MSFRIGAYAARTLPQGTFMTLFIACTGAGKSVALRDLLGINADQYDVLICCCNSPSAALDFKKMTIPALVYDHWPEDTLWKLCESNEQRRLAGRVQLRFLLVMDDLIHDTTCMKSKLLAKLATAGRHYGLQVVLLAQFIKAIPPIVRENVKKCFISKIQGSSTTKEVVDTYRDCLDKRVFDKMLRAATCDYGFLVVDTTAQSNRPEDRFFQYRARVDCPFTLVGSPVLYQLQALLDLVAACVETVARVDAASSQSHQVADLIIRR